MGTVKTYRTVRNNLTTTNRGVSVLDITGFQRLVALSVKVSPMVNLFEAIGFPEAETQRAVADYKYEFM